MEELSSRHLDLVCIGFGATSLALAVALRDRNAAAADDDVVFLESQPRSRWRPCTDGSPSSRVGSSFLNDLITSENPRSKFTFLNYLHATGRLVLFANDSQIRPAREMFADYLRWCASFFDDRVRYGVRVTAVVPSLWSSTGGSNNNNKIQGWKVVYSDAQGHTGFVTAKQVVCAVGNSPRIPAPLAGLRQVVHSSDCLQAVASVLNAPHPTGGPRIAVVGDGQTAAEVFDHLVGIRSDHKVTWFTRDSVLRGQDETPL